MKSHLRFGKLLWSIVFPAVVVAANLPFGFFGVTLVLADETLPLDATAFVLVWGAVNAGLVALYWTRKQWQPVAEAWIGAARLRLGLVGDDEEVEFLDEKASAKAGDAHLLAKQARAMDRRYRDNPDVPRLYGEAISGLIDTDTALAVELFQTYFPRFQRVFDGPQQLKLARALRAADPDMAARSLELWLQQHKAPTAARCEIMMLAAQILDRNLGMREAAAAQYRQIVLEFPQTPAAENAANRIDHLRGKAPS